MANKNLKSIKFPNLPDTYIVPQVDNTLTQAGRPADAKATGDAISALGDSVDEAIEPLKEDLSTLNTEGTVPTSEQMLSDNYTEDSVPYHFRKTASDNADREELEIVGGSVAWNQLVRNGNFETSQEWFSSGQVKSFNISNNKVTVVCNAATDNTIMNQGSHKFVSGHKYYMCFKYEKESTSNTIYGTFTSNPSGIYKVFYVPNTSGFVGVIVNASNDVTGSFRVGMRDSAPSGEWTYSLSDVMAIDLTQMFGSTIADHIYSLEQATAGAGVALFRSLFNRDYYSYDAGSMQSVSGLSEHKAVGFNCFDEVWESGTYTGNTPVVNAEWSRSKNYIPVLSGCAYYFNFDGIDDTNHYLILHQYDSNHQEIKYVRYNYNTTITLDGRCCFIHVQYKYPIAQVTEHPVCINLSDPAKNGQYEPYVKHSYALDDSLTLRGIPTLVDGKIKWDGDIYPPSGKVTRKYGIVDLGTLTWSYSDTYKWFNPTRQSLNPNTIKHSINNNVVNNVLTAKYVTSSRNVIADDLTLDKLCCVNDGGYFIVRDLAYTDAATFKAAMSGVYLVYEKDTPTTEQADPYVSPQICHYDGTEEFVSTGIIPVGHNTKYPDNMRAKLDGLPWNFASLIAPTESGFKATRNYTTGQLLIVNNVLYKATANIANGATITVGTNVTATTLAEVIAALS